jgi:hypothetical protein
MIEFPVLNDTDIRAIIEWVISVRAVIRRFQFQNVQLRLFVDSWIVEIVEDTDPECFEGTPSEVLEKLLAQFRPRESETMLGVLKTFKWITPTFSPGRRPVASGLLPFLERFCCLVNNSCLTNAGQTRQLSKALQGELGRRVAIELEANPGISFEELIQFAKTAARKLDAMSEGGYDYARHVSPAEPIPQNPRPQTQERSQAYGNQPIRLFPLTPDDRARYVAENRCLRCRQIHPGTSACPRNGSPAAFPTTSVNNNNPWTQNVQYRHSPHSQLNIQPPQQQYYQTPKRQQYQQTTQPQHQYQQVTKPQTPARNKPTNVQSNLVYVPGEANQGLVPAQQVVPQQLQQQQQFQPLVANQSANVQSHLVDTHGVTQEAQQALRIQITDTQKITRLVVPAVCPQWSTPIPCRIDTGAERSIITRAFADKLPMAQQVINPVIITGFNNVQSTTERSIQIPLQLTPDAPVRAVSCLVVAEALNEEPILIGLPDIAGFAVTIGDKATLEWRQQPTVDDTADPVDIPEPANENNPEGGPHVKIGDHLNPEQAGAAGRLCLQFPDLWKPVGPIPAKTGSFRIELQPNAVPIRQKTRPLSPDKREFVKQEVDRLLSLGIIRESHSPWASPLRITLKSNGKYRMCVDFRALNDVTVRDAHPIPDIPSVLSSFAGKPFMACFDMTSGYHQMPVVEECRYCLAFTCYEGLFEYCRLPFGPCNGPGAFQRELNHMFQDMPFVIHYFDDCAVVASTFGEFMHNLEAFFRRSQDCNLHLNLEKSVIGPSRLPYVGRLVGPDSIEINPDRIDPIAKLSIPHNKSELQSFLGFAQWFSIFIPHLATEEAGLRELVLKNTIWDWTQVHQAAFERIVQLITHAPILAQLDPQGFLILATDASTIGIAGVLLQKVADKPEQPLAFFSRKLSHAEQNYSTIEQEALAIIWSLDRCRPFITGHITILTDHSNLQFLRTSINHRVQRWGLILSEFDATIIYRPGKDNSVADCLSRMGFPREPPTQTAEVHAVNTPTTTPDPLNLRGLIQGLPHSVDNGIIHLKDRPSDEILTRIWALAHDDPLAGHQGTFRTLFNVAQALKWEGMSADIGRLCKECVLCQKTKGSRPISAELNSTQAEFPFESVFLDFIGPLKPSKDNRYILTIVDRFSHWLHLKATPAATAEMASETLFNEWFCIHGLPKLLTSDGGSTFTAKIFEDMTQSLKVDHHISAPLHPEGHGSVERANHSIVQCIRTLLRSHPNWSKILPAIEFALNTTYSRTLGTTPFNVIHGFNPRLLIHHDLEAIPADRLDDGNRVDPEPLEFSSKLVSRATKVFEQVRSITKTIHDADLKAYQEKAHGKTSFQPGDHVLVWFPRTDKLDFPWRGPYQVIDLEDNKLIYTLADLITGDTSRVHTNRLRQFYPGNLTPDQLRAEATKEGEFLIQDVISHERRPPGNELWFLVDWVGYPSDLPMEDRWVCYGNCRWAPAVKEYMRAHHLTNKLH